MAGWTKAFYTQRRLCVKHVSCSLEKTKTLIDPGSSFTDVLPERKLAVEADTKFFLNVCLLLHLHWMVCSVVVGR